MRVCDAHKRQRYTHQPSGRYQFASGIILPALPGVDPKPAEQQDEKVPPKSLRYGQDTPLRLSRVNTAGCTVSPCA
jgi:hypothetical protein